MEQQASAQHQQDQQQQQHQQQQQQMELCSADEQPNAAAQATTNCGVVVAAAVLEAPVPTLHKGPPIAAPDDAVIRESPLPPPPPAAAAAAGRTAQHLQAAGRAGGTKRMVRSRVGEPEQQPALPPSPSPQLLQQQQQHSPLQAPCYQRGVGASMTSLHIHGSSQLPPDLLLTNPVVRLHVVTAATGEYVRLSHQLAGISTEHQPGATHDDSSSDGSAPQRARHVLSAEQHAELLDFPGRPCLCTLDNSSAAPKAGLLEHVPPLQTRPAEDRGRSTSSISSSSSVCCSSGLAAMWDEELSIDVPPEALQAADALLLLEVLQLPGGFQRFQV